MGYYCQRDFYVSIDENHTIFLIRLDVLIMTNLFEQRSY